MVYKDKSQKWNNKVIWIFEKGDLNDFLKSNMDFPKSALYGFLRRPLQASACPRACDKRQPFQKLILKFMKIIMRVALTGFEAWIKIDSFS